MAKRKSRHSHRRRRRVSGIGDSNALQMVLGAVAGAIGGEVLVTKLTSVDDKVKGGAMFVLPVLFGKKLKGPLMQGLGIGFAVTGGRMLAKSFGIVSGVPIVSGTRRIRGPYNYPVISGSADQPYLRTGAAGGRQQVVSGFPKPTASDYAGAMMKSDYSDTDR